MSRTHSSRLVALGAAACFLAMGTPGAAMVHDGRSYAIEAAIPELDRKQNPFTLRHTWWNGELEPGKSRVIRHQLFKGNEYWFWAGCSELSAKIVIHIYDSEGKRVEAESWKRGHVAGARIVPSRTASYLIRVTLREAEDPPAEWAVIYGFR
ncbi:MAG TPA: hypothetical protein VMN36_06240 [Verrucomicrobiales bacterium]|nr:hypothetical protein [Verrucomicrobiales bacterium]